MVTGRAAEWVEPDGAGGPGFVVRRVPAYRAAKAYRCPGCDQEIARGSGHVVAWPADDVDDRRHWHPPCWERRDRRRPRPLRSRDAPRH